MNFYRRIFFPILSQFDPERTHDLTLSLLMMAQRVGLGRGVLHRLRGPVPKRPCMVFGLTFPNVLGVAAGFDKDARVALGLGMLGFGHVEAGTVTPRPQMGNPRPRLFRLPDDEALINRMGFPNAGVEAAVSRLKFIARTKHDFVLGVSLGKQKETPLQQAAGDYAAVMRAVYPWADYLAVNVSSPNTPGLRDLQGAAYLGALMATLQAENEALAEKHGVPRRPLLIKVSPDLTWAELDEIIAAALAHNVSGIIATNTTIGRVGLRDPLRAEQGGLSGRPLRERSNAIIAYISRQAGDRLPVIGVGGVRTAADVQEKLDAGAALVQLYTGLVYEGPGIAGRILRELAAGVKSVVSGSRTT
ncbi:MAG: quinone-dependent dihydroorotate dehydrogenase [Anaerolineae bacterium]